MNNQPKRKYTVSQHYTLSKIAHEYNTTVGTILNWVFINETLYNELQKLIEGKLRKGSVLLSPCIAENIFKTIDEK